MAKFPISYNFNRTYYWNFKNGPKKVGGGIDVPKTKPVNFLGFKINSPLGIAAGPLLNGRWISYYSKLGYDILTYKTARSLKWPSNKMPNVTYVKVKNGIAQIARRSKSITNSFGMPSFPPSFWMRDVARIKKALAPRQILVMSVVGTPQNGDLIEDFVHVAKLAAQTSADAIEINLSCPNVTGEGVLCETLPESQEVIQKAKRAIGPGKPLLVKIGPLAPKKLFPLLDAIEEYADAVVSINSIPMKVEQNGKTFLVGGNPTSGICGEEIKEAAEKELDKIIGWKKKNRAKMAVVSVGGVMDVEDIKERVARGASAVEVATAALLNPGLAIAYKKSKM